MNDVLERQVRSAFEEVSQSGNDYRGQVAHLASHMLLVRAQEQHVAYILDTRNVLNVRTVMLKESAPQTTKFNIYEQIIPRFARNSPVKHRKS